MAASQLCINAWSGPRSLSTALMYSWAQPLYAHYLLTTGLEHPCRDLVMKAQSVDADAVINSLLSAGTSPIKFIKHMAKHMARGPTRTRLLKGTRHILLIRDPMEMLHSFAKVVPPTLDETGLPALCELYSELTAMGQAPPVIDASDLMSNPEGTLRALCAALDIPFEPGMLHWEAGPRPEDGPWAPAWYKNIHASTGFSQAPRIPKAPFPLELYELLAMCRPFYATLAGKKLSPWVLCGGGEGPCWQPPPPPPALPVSKNKQLFVSVGGQLLLRDDAKVSVLDSIVQGGDGVWEGLRVYEGKVFELERHLDRLFDSAKAMAFQGVPTREQVREEIVRTLAINGMKDHAHIRLTLTRGKKVTSGMSPEFNKYGCTLIVLAEWKPPVYDNTKGVTLITASVRRNPPQCVDSKIHHNNLINNIMAKIEANVAGAADAVMLDVEGFVAETNATNIFAVKKGVLLVPAAGHALPGITRSVVMELAQSLGREVLERRVTLSELYAADEVFTTGTMGELTPVTTIDGRTIGHGHPGSVTRQLQEAYAQATKSSGFELPV
eukprot:jgi/Mesvir1/1680/Mv08662-RA.2